MSHRVDSSRDGSARILPTDPDVEHPDHGSVSLAEEAAAGGYTPSTRPIPGTPPKAPVAGTR